MTLVKESATVLGGEPLSAETVSNILTHQLRDGRPHPLAQLSAAEIEQVAAAFRAEHHGKTLCFKWISSLEPPKRLLKLFLAADRQNDKSLPSMPRLADVVYYVVEDKQFFQAHYNVSLRQLIKSEVVPEEFKPPGDPFEIVELEQILLRDARFQHALKQFKLPADAILAVDPWIYGSDTRDPIERLVTFMVYIRNPKNNHPDSNHYSFPIPLYPVMSTATREVLHIWDGCTGGPEDGMKTHTWDTEDPMGHLEGNEYLHELLDDPLRSDLKPLLVSQPEGPSFSIDGNKIYWQKWTFIISFNMREGLVFHDIYYDGRSVFYRLSMAEMTVPYGDPRPPYHRKQAFDAGDAGLGFCANELDLGCDCLGVIKYFSAVFARPDGSARVAKNVVCMHEVDDGILSKHTNYRTNVASVIRSRQLVFQIICTVSNYEYIWLWKFDQAGAIHHEMRATGILSTQYIDKGKVSPYGNIVSPGVLAANHQHLFSLRVDPAIEGHANSVSIEDSIRMPAGPDNPFLTGWNVEKTIMKESGWVDAAPEKSRVFKIVNKDKINPVSKRPMGYKLVPHPSQLMLAHEGSVAHDRAQYAGHHLWVTQYRDDELYPSGYWTNQSSGNAGGVQSMVARKDNVEQDDIVLWSTYALTHNPRVEDFPVMPYEQLVISLKPADFFTKNPALDVPPSDPRFNRSVAYEDAIRGMGAMRLQNGGAHDRCCS